LKISDDGCGISESENISAEEKNGFGMVGMKERARLIGGDLTIESAAEKGTNIFMAIKISSINERN
jgi:signal transduction histidine kinase